MLNEDQNGNIIDQNKSGLARELARMNLSLNYYTQWYWKIDLHNLLHFLKLRADSHAQYEIRAYADIMLNITKAWVPMAYAAFLNYKKNAVNISEKSLNMLKKLLHKKPVDFNDSDMSKGEWNEFCKLFALDQLKVK